LPGGHGRGVAAHHSSRDYVRLSFGPVRAGAELAAPAEPSEQYLAARPEWYFLFLFQLLKYFSEFTGAIVLPSVVMVVLFLMPIVGRWQMGHLFNIGFLAIILCAAISLTCLAWLDDHRGQASELLKYHPGRWEVAGAVALPALAMAVIFLMPLMRRWRRGALWSLGLLAAVVFGGIVPVVYVTLQDDRRAGNSKDYLEGVAAAQRDAERAIELAHAPTGIPPRGRCCWFATTPRRKDPSSLSATAATVTRRPPANPENRPKAHPI